VDRVDANGRPAGLSTFDAETRLVTSGRIWVLRAESPLSDGLEVVAEVGGHHAIRPATDMTEPEFLDRLAQLPWEDTGRERRRR
jgi:hypothetical protein